MQAVSRILWAGLWLGLTAPAFAQSGLRVGESDMAWPRWQARIGLASASLGGSTSLVSASPWAGSGLQLRSAQVLGDYYFSGSGLLPRHAWGGGFRATSGLLIGSHGVAPAAPARGAGLSLSMARSSAAQVGEDGGAVPYVGVGYTGLSHKGFSFTADLGLVAARSTPGGLRAGRALSGAQSIDDLVRDLRLEPVLQMGVSYSF